MPGTDFEAVTVVGDRVFAISEGEVSFSAHRAQMDGGPAVDSSGTAVKSSGEGLDWQLRVLQKWTLQGLVDTEGITHTPSALDGEGGSLYISTKHDIHVFEVPPSGSAAAFSVSSAFPRANS